MKDPILNLEMFFFVDCMLFSMFILTYSVSFFGKLSNCKIMKTIDLQLCFIYMLFPPFNNARSI